MEKIVSIEEGSFKVNGSQYVGFLVVTDQQTIKVGVSDGQYCCEDFGYLITNDDTKDFIGANLLKVVLVDELLNNKEIKGHQDIDRNCAMFVNFETSNGLLQLVAYNYHDGYYGHDAVLISKQLNHSETI